MPGREPSDQHTAAKDSRLDPAEKVARAAARIIDSIGEDSIAQARRMNATIKGCGGQHFLTNGRLVALADAVEAWRGR